MGFVKPTLNLIYLILSYTCFSFFIFAIVFLCNSSFLYLFNCIVFEEPFFNYCTQISNLTVRLISNEAEISYIELQHTKLGKKRSYPNFSVQKDKFTISVNYIQLNHTFIIGTTGHGTTTHWLSKSQTCR